MNGRAKRICKLASGLVLAALVVSGVVLVVGIGPLVVAEGDGHLDRGARMRLVVSLDRAGPVAEPLERAVLGAPQGDVVGDDRPFVRRGRRAPI